MMLINLHICSKRPESLLPWVRFIINDDDSHEDAIAKRTDQNMTLWKIDVEAMLLGGSSSRDEGLANKLAMESA